MCHEAEGDKPEDQNLARARTELGIGPAPHDALHATDDHVVVATQGVPWVQLCDAGIWPEAAAGQ